MNNGKMETYKTKSQIISDLQDEVLKQKANVLAIMRLNVLMLQTLQPFAANYQAGVIQDDAHKAAHSVFTQLSNDLKSMLEGNLKPQGESQNAGEF